MKKKIVLLAGENSPAIVPIIREFQRKEIYIDSIILDKKGLSDLEVIRYCDRIGISPQDIDLLGDHAVPYCTYKVSNHNNRETSDLIKRIGADILVNAGTPRILKKQILEAPSLGIINCHPGILPFFRGCSCVEWAIHLDEEVGNSIHWMTKKIDRGAVLNQEVLTFSIYDRYADVRRKVYESGFQLLASTVSKLLEGSIEAPSSLCDVSGRYFEPIPDDFLALIKLKLISGKYKYQLRV